MNGPFDWLNKRARDAAPHVLGSVLQVGDRSGIIVEVEAYEGQNDGASHAARGVTPRNEVMFGPPGMLYVYKIYGMHWCANIVCGPPQTPGAVLIRAVEPLAGVDHMWTDRPKAKRLTDLCSGPGKLCAALGITGSDDGVDLRSPVSSVQLHAGNPPQKSDIEHGPRVGITKAVEFPWRFATAGNAHVSKPKLPTVNRQP